MIPVSAHPVTLGGPAVVWSPPDAMARALATAYLRYVSAYWRGDPDVARFATRLSACSRTDLPPAPTRPAAMVSPHGGGGRGIHWYEIDGEVVGYVPGVHRGYRVPVLRIPALVRSVPATPGAGGTVATTANRRASSPIRTGMRPLP